MSTCKKDRGYGEHAQLCPVCETHELTGLGVWNPILGEVCSVDCLTAYWGGKKGGKDE